MRWKFMNSMLLGLFVSATLSGCGPSFPYYTIEGSRESKVVVIHHSESETTKIPVGTGMGGGLDSVDQGAMMGGADAVVEGPEGKAKVTMTASGVVIHIKKVEYDGKDVKFHEPVL